MDFATKMRLALLRSGLKPKSLPKRDYYSSLKPRPASFKGHFKPGTIVKTSRWQGGASIKAVGRRGKGMGSVARRPKNRSKPIPPAMRPLLNILPPPRGGGGKGRGGKQSTGVAGGKRPNPRGTIIVKPVPARLLKK